jgi:hypothetical protein
MKSSAVLATASFILATTSYSAQVSFSATAPTVGPNDIASLTGAAAVGNNVSSGDPNATYLADDRPIQGQTFTTGNNPAGYQLTAVTLRQVTYSTYALIPDITYTIRITTPVPSPPNRLAVLATETAFAPANAPLNFPTIADGNFQGPGSGRFITFTLANPVALNPNTTYGFDIGGGIVRHYWEMDGTSSSPYAGGVAYTSGAGGIGNTTRTPRTGDHAFVVALSIPGLPVVTTPTISPSNTVYSGTMVTLRASAAGSPPLHYQWREDTGFGPVSIPGANNTNLVVDTSGTFGSWSYDLVVTNNQGSVTSAPVTLTVLEANPPVVTADISPSPAMRYEGQEVTFTAAFDGTQPITYQWRNFNGDIPSATNTTLTLTNLQLSDTEDYWLVASNPVGTAQTSVSSLTVLQAPPPPAPGTFAHAVRTNGPIAYWRLNDPAGTQLIHDSAGTHNQLNQNITLAVPGLQAPAYPGFPSDNTAASFSGSSAATGTASLNGLSAFTVMGWFNPGGPNGPYAGLFGQNDLLEVGYSDGAGVNLWVQLNGIWTTPRTGTNGFEIGQWYFVAIVANGTSVDIYINGVQRAHETGGAPSATSGFGFNIGGGGIFGTSGDNFNGLIEDVAIFDKALSQERIQDLYSVAVGLVAPSILVQPTSQALYFGRTARFTVGGIGGTQPRTYQWQHGGANLNNGGNISGATSPSLTINNAGAANVGNYQLIVSNAAGSISSSVISLTLVQPATPYESTSMSLNPLTYWRLNDLSDPASGNALAADYWGGFAGTYGITAQNGFNGIMGPRPSAGFNAFEASNTAAQFMGGTPDSFVSVPALNLNTNEVTFTMWIHPNGTPPDYAGLFFTRSGTQGGVGYGGDFSGNRGQLAYTWNNNTTWEFQSGLIVPEGKWSFVAVVIKADEARLYLYYKDANGADVLLSTNNPIAHISEAWNGTATIGRDPGHDNRVFGGVIDEVAVFNRALTPTQVLNLYQAGDTPGVRLTIEGAAPNLRLSWPQGTLQEALSVTGPWTNNPASSPYVFPPAGLQKFYRVRVSP